MENISKPQIVKLSLLLDALKICDGKEVPYHIAIAKGEFELKKVPRKWKRKSLKLI